MINLELLCVVKRLQVPLVPLAVVLIAELSLVPVVDLGSVMVEVLSSLVVVEVLSSVVEVDLPRMDLSLLLSNSGGHLEHLIGSLVSTATNERKFRSKQLSIPIGQESRSLTRGVLRPSPPLLNTTSCLSLSP